MTPPKQGFKVGDKIRSTNVLPAGTRVNGALDLEIAYYGTKTVVYTWRNPCSGTTGETCMGRSSFDAEHEKITKHDPAHNHGKLWIIVVSNGSRPGYSIRLVEGYYADKTQAAIRTAELNAARSMGDDRLFHAVSIDAAAVARDEVDL